MQRTPVVHIHLGADERFPHPDSFFLGRGEAVIFHVTRAGDRSVEAFTIVRGEPMEEHVRNTVVYPQGECGCP